MDKPSPYFEKYLEEKFKALGDQLDEQYSVITGRMDANDRKVNFLNQKVWMAMGGMGVILVVGVVFILYMKEVNKNQLYQATNPIKLDVQALRNEVEVLKDNLNDGIIIQPVN